MPPTESRPGQKSLVFDAPVGSTCPAGEFAPQDYLIDPARYESEGNWAFCRFNNAEVPAARMGFQRGGYNGGGGDAPVDPSLLQLHLELMTREGAVLWLPTGRYRAQSVRTHPTQWDIRLEDPAAKDREIFCLRGWPRIACHFRSDDGDAEANLELNLHTVSILPDCLLPRCVFGMFESLGDVRGSVRYRSKTTAVEGRVFFDHPRILHRRHDIPRRQMYLYTTLYFPDGSGIFGYHTLDTAGCRIDYYNFGIHVDRHGKGRFLSDARCTALQFDSDHIPRRWRLQWADGDLRLDLDITAGHHSILRSWGAPNAPVHRKEFSIMALVLDGAGAMMHNGTSLPLNGIGLAEYYDVDYWPLRAAT